MSRSAEDVALELLREARQHARSLARAQRTQEIRGRSRPRRFDDQGLHPYSIEWGRIRALEELFPTLANPALDPVSMFVEEARKAEEEWSGWE